MSDNATEIWPSEIRLNPGKDCLSVRFSGGISYNLTAEYLRVFSPSAEVQGHTPSERKTIGGKRAVKIIRIEHVGHYAIRIVFEDGHSTGIYTWAYLYELGRDKQKLWQNYLDELSAKRLKREI